MRRRVGSFDIGLVASEAAIELDQIIRGKPTTGTALADLSGFLKSDVAEVDKPTSPDSLLSLSTLLAVNSAVRQLGSVERSVEGLIASAQDIARNLSRATTDETGKTSLTELRAFCLALSQAAARRPARPKRPLGVTRL